MADYMDLIRQNLDPEFCHNLEKVSSGFLKMQANKTESVCMAVGKSSVVSCYPYNSHIRR